MAENMLGGVTWQRWVKNRRKELGLTQAKLAKKINYSLEMISHVERGLDRPSTELALLLVAALGVPTEDQAEFIRLARLDPLAEDQHTPQPARLRIPGLPTTPLIGRNTEIERVHRALERKGARLVAITGPGGVGKTRLAMQVAQDREQSYGDSVFWLDLTPLTDPAGVLKAIARVLNIKESASEPLLESLQNALCDSDILLVLDNCEQVRGLGPVLNKLLSATILRVLATSRRRIRLRGEQQISLKPLALPANKATSDLAQLRGYSALALFLERAQETSPQFILDTSNADAVRQICTALDGLPLALELAAARIRVLPPAAMLSRRHETLTWLVGGPEDMSDHQQTLDRTLAWSYNLLNPRQQAMFRRLGVFAGGFTLPAAAAMCSLQPGSDGEVLTIIGELDEWNLLYRSSDPDSELRYDMLATIKEFAIARMEECRESNELRRGHLEFYRSLAEAQRASAVGADAEAWLQLLETEKENFRAALTWGSAYPDAAQSVKRLAVALGQFWETHGYWQEGRDWFTRLLHLDDGHEDQLAAQLHYYAGRFAYLQGDYRAAAPLLEDSLSQAQAHNDTTTQMSALNTIGWISFSKGYYRRARPFYEQSLDLARQLGDITAIATALSVLGQIELGTGDLQQAEKMLQESLLLRQMSNDKLGCARSLNALGFAAQRREDYVAARQILESGLAQFRSLGNKLGEVLVLGNLGWVALAQGQYDEAQARLEGALVLAHEVGSAWSKVTIISYMGWVALEQGNLAKAATLLADGLAGAAELSLDPATVVCFVGLARLEVYKNDMKAAASYLSAAEQLQQELDSYFAPLLHRTMNMLKRDIYQHIG